MRQRNALIGFGITAGVILLVSVTSRMALRGSLLDQTGAPEVSSEASSASSSSLPPLADPLSDAALANVRYGIADPSVRYALSAAGMTLDASFNEDGTWKAPGRNPLRPWYVDDVRLSRDKAAVMDVDADRRPDTLVPMTVKSGAMTFSQVSIVRNLGGDTGVYAGAYPLGPGTDITALTPQPDGTVRVQFSYRKTSASAPVDAALNITLRPSRTLDSGSSSSDGTAEAGK